MKKSLILSIILVLNSNILAQNNFGLDVGLGYYLNNSENSLDINYDKEYKEYYSFGLSFQTDSIIGYNWIFEYNYQMINKDKVTELLYTDEEGNPLGSIPINLTLINHYIDVDYYHRIDRNFALCFGPSFVLTHRVIETPKVDSYKSLYDRLASLGLGFNGFVEFSFPLDENISIVSKLKLRYSHSIWFDEGLRKLDDYNQEFLTVQATIGLLFSL